MRLQKNCTQLRDYTTTIESMVGKERCKDLRGICKELVGELEAWC